MRRSAHHSLPGRLFRLARQRDGATAIEFAIIAPVFFLLIYGIVEICLMVFFQSMLIEGAEAGTEYMRERRLSAQAITDAGLREAICDAISIGGMSCTAGKLKVAPFYAGVPNRNGDFGVPDIIENRVEPRLGGRAPGGQFILALGYNWGISLPSSSLLLPQGDDGSQIQAHVYTVVTERVWDDGVRR
jgi:hypothetical protein